MTATFGVVTYTLDRDMLARAVQLGVTRNDRNQASGVVDQRRAQGKSSRAVWIEGAVAEVGFGLCYGLDLDWSTTPRHKTPDYVVAGTAIDVKAITKRHHNLVANRTKGSADADVYVLVYVEPSGLVELLGWADAQEFITDQHLRATSGAWTEGYLMARQHLRPMAELEQRLGLTRAADLCPIAGW